MDTKSMYESLDRLTATIDAKDVKIKRLVEALRNLCEIGNSAQEIGPKRDAARAILREFGELE